jgi:Ca2+-binding EF-hand superfamily protein
MYKYTRIGFALVVSALVCGTVSVAQADDAKRDQEIEAKFKAADKDHDGKLTLSEAKAGMPRVARGFDKIDADKKGFVTLDQIKAFAAKM